MKNKGFRPLRHLKLAMRAWRERVHEYSLHCLQSGFIPFTFGPAQFLARMLAKLLVFIQLGKIRVIGKENTRIPGRFIFCPNHSSMFDAPVLYSIMKRKESMRYMTAFEEMRGLWGFKAILMGAMGCFPVDRTKGKSVIEPAIEVLTSGQNLTIFPEGRVSETGVCQPFKNGAAIIGSAALKKLGSSTLIGIVPIHINYHHRDNDTARTNFFKMGLKWRGGVTVTVGKPIYFNDMENMPAEEIMAEVRKFICATQSSDVKMPSSCASSS